MHNSQLLRNYVVEMVAVNMRHWHRRSIQHPKIKNSKWWHSTTPLAPAFYPATKKCDRRKRINRLI